MAIETSTRDGSLVVRILENRLDASNSDGLTDELQGLVNEGSSHLILDLSGVTFLDSSALGAIVSIVKDLGDDGRAQRVTSAHLHADASRSDRRHLWNGRRGDLCHGDPMNGACQTRAAWPSGSS